MASSTILTDYLSHGVAASRPASPVIASPCLALWYSTDTDELDGWTGSAWVALTIGASSWTAGVVGHLGTTLAIHNTNTLDYAPIAASSLVGNAGTVSAVPGVIAIGANLTLSPTGTLSVGAPGTGTVTQVVGGAGTTGGTITTTGTISGLWQSGTVTSLGTTLALHTNVLDYAPIAATSLIGNAGTAAAIPGVIALGSGLTLSALGTLSVSTAGGSVTSVVGGAGTTGGTITTAGTITGLWQSGTVTSLGTGMSIIAGALTPAVAAADHGLVVNSGTVQINNVVTLTGTAGSTIPVNPGSGTTDVVINLAAAGGTQTLTYTGAFAYQPFTMHLKQGATASVVVLNSGTVNGFGYGATQGPTSFTITPSANVTDSIFCKGITTAYARVYALDQGFTV